MSTPDATGAIYISDTGASVVRKLYPNGTLRIVAGSLGVSGASGNWVRGTSALLRAPRGLTLINGSGAVLVSDVSAVRVLYPNLTIATLVGSLGATGSGGNGGPG